MSLVVDIKKKLGNFQLDIDFEAGNEILALLGASGCGKSMTLKCIAGVVKPDSGRIISNGRTLFDSEKGINMPPQERRTGLVFQNYALFPNMTVRQNIAAGAMRKKDRGQRKKYVDEIIERMGLETLTKRYPGELSGGQQQRTALARVLVSEPDILLLDEPLSALDSHLRFKIEKELREIFRQFGKTVILVSHNRDEVYRMADQIAVVHGGEVECFGEKKEVFRTPQTKNGAILTGCKNISRIKVIDEEHIRAEDWGMTLKVPNVTEDLQYAGIRMHDIIAGEGENSFRCRVMDVVENPFSTTVFLKAPEMTGDQVLGWEMEKKEWESVRGEEVIISIPPEKILLLIN